MSYKTAQMERVFDKLQVECKPSNHHRSGFIVDDDGKKLFPPVFFSKGHKDIGPVIANKIRKAMYLDQTSFDELLKCHMSRREYLAYRRTNDRA
jgi:hypothetical protein